MTWILLVTVCGIIDGRPACITGKLKPFEKAECQQDAELWAEQVRRNIEAKGMLTQAVTWTCKPDGDDL